MSRFEKCQLITGRWEGGWSNHPSDPGGKTMYGLTDRVWQAYLRQNGKPSRPVKSATQPEVAELFKRQYWDVVQGDKLPPGLDLAVYDFAINSGPARAVRHLQAALGVRQDGEIGHVTLAAAREAYDRDDDDDVIVRVMESRQTFLQGLGTWGTFGKGWMNRLRDVGTKAARMEEIEDEALAWSMASTDRNNIAEGPPPVIYAPDKAAAPLPDPVVPVAVPDHLGKITAGAGIVSTLVAAVTSPWALGAVVVLVIAGGLTFWLHKTGRMTFNSAAQS